MFLLFFLCERRPEQPASQAQRATWEAGLLLCGAGVGGITHH